MFFLALARRACAIGGRVHRSGEGELMDRPADQTGGLGERFGASWHPGLRVEDVAEFLRGAGPDERLEVVILDQRSRRRHGLPIPLAEYLQHFPDLAADPD